MPTGNRVTFSDRKKITDNDDLFRCTAQTGKPESHENNSKTSGISRLNKSENGSETSVVYEPKIQESANSDQGLRRQTYYLSEEIIEALDSMSFATKKDKSRLVRELLSNSELQKYFNFKSRLIV